MNKNHIFDLTGATLAETQTPGCGEWVKALILAAHLAVPIQDVYSENTSV